MSRAFSTSAKAFLKFVWDGMSKEPMWEDVCRNTIEGSSKLPHVEKAIVKGKAHTSIDPKEHVTLVLYDKNDARITSAHVYEDGTVEFSKQKYN